jgi:NADH dehydrogenase
VILVAGGTGALGRRVVQRLADRGEEQVRVLTRDPLRARRLPGPVQVVTGDLRTDPLDRLLAGTSTVISAVHGFAGPTRTSPEVVDRDANARLVAAATRAGVTHFVLVSVVGAAPEHPMSLHRMKYAAEQHLHGSGLSATTVRATSFLETWMNIIGGKLAGGGPALVLGPGRNPINFVSVEDVADYVCLAAAGDHRIGDHLSVGGPENLGFTDIADHLLARTPGGARTRHVPLTALRAMAVLARPVRPALARQARAAVVMNTTDMTFDATPLRHRFPELRTTALADLTGSAGSRTP